MENLTYIIISGIIISLTSLLGVLLVKSNKKIESFVKNNLEILGALSGGIFLFTSFSMAKTSIHILDIEKAIVSFIIGMLFFIALQKIIISHRHKGDCKEHEHAHNRRSALKILIGDAIHNIADGLLLIASFGINLTIGISTAVSIFIHEAPQEISEFIVLRKSGYSVREASIKNFITALSIFIGIALGFIFMKDEILRGYLIGISATFFLGVVFTDLFPIKEISKHKNKIKIIFMFTFGVVFMYSVMHLIGHSH